ncbi:MAG: hypothetical protein R3C05_00870 [Pirellulaceae bacterium]
MLDTQATAQIANAFAINPWIESVTRVQKSAGNVEVHVNYRRPVAMVEVFSRHPDVKGLAYLPVDGNSVLLPTEDFSRADTHDYIHIVVKDAYPISDFGSKFGDTRVADAALLASLLVNYRKSLGIVAITIDERSRQDDGPPALNLVLKDGSQIRWGSPPGKELGNEPHTSEKMRVLLSNSKSNDLDVLVAQPADDGYLQR